ncbi:MAG: His/Gly/Thr/Pro-type tRNA ligase C-terminal domain-containing protein, partial [Schleiferiaceae bacterium]
GRKVQYFDPETNESYTPYVVETSVGLDRLFLAVLSTALDEEVLEDGSSRTVLRLPYAIAPIQVAILPLLKKDGLPELAQKVYEELRWDFQVSVDEKDAIGKRYRRQDAVGTPYCITVDHQSVEDGTVTIRERDSMAQERIPINDLSSRLQSSVSMTSLLKKLS